MKKYKILLCVCMFLAVQPTSLFTPEALAASPEYKDISEAADWAKPAIQRASETGLVTGYVDSSYKPLTGISRAEVAAIMARALKLDVSAQPATGFKDVNPNAWYVPYIAAVEKAGLMTGVGKGKFEPDRHITREELAALWVQSTNLDVTGDGAPTPFKNWNTEKGTIDLETLGQDTALTYKDADKISGWAKPYIETVNRLGLMFNSSGEFEPSKETQRQELALAIMEFLPRYGQMSIGQIQGDTITADGTTYRVADSVKGLLRESNLEALRNETLRFETEGDVITKILYLSVGKNGSGKAAMLDCGGTTIEKLRIYDNKVTVKNAVVGDLVLPDPSTGSLNLEAVRITGNKMIKTDTGLWPEKQKEPVSEPAPQPSQPSQPSAGNASAGSGSSSGSGSGSGSGSSGSGSSGPVTAPGGAEPTAPAAVSGVEVTSADNVTTILNTQTLQMSAVITPADAADKRVTWSVFTGLDGDAAPVISDTGLLSIQGGSGSVLVKARSVSNPLIEGFKVIQVTAPAPTPAPDEEVAVLGITVSSEGDVDTITNAQTLQMNAHVLPANAANPAVAWSVSTLSGDASASINEQGLLSIAGGIGTVQVRATSVSNGTVYGTKDIAITAPAVEVLGIVVRSAGNVSSMTNAQTLQMSTTFIPADATDQRYTWSVSAVDGNVMARIGANGVLSIDGGTGTVRVKAVSLANSSVYGYKDIQVTAATVWVNGIQVRSAGDITSIMNTQTLQMSAEVLPENATDKRVNWSVSSLSAGVVASINENGLLSIIGGAGTVRVTATSVNNSLVSGKMDITVTDPHVGVTGVTVRSEGDVDTINNTDTVQLFATILPDNATDKRYTWYVSTRLGDIGGEVGDDDILRITRGTYGILRATATSVDNGNAQGYTEFLVNDPQITDITLTSEGGVTSIANDQTLKMIATLTAPPESYRGEIWSVETLSGDVSAEIDYMDNLKINSGTGTVRVKVVSVGNRTVQDTMDITVTDSLGPGIPGGFSDF